MGKSSKQGKGKQTSKGKVPVSDKPLKDGEGTKADRRKEEIVDTALRGLHKSQCNDPAWYSKDAQLILDVGRIPFAYSAGQPVSVRGIKDVMPGVMAIHFTPVVGVASNLADPINVASTRYFTRLREKNSGFSQGDPADFTMMMVALDSLYMLHAFMRRAYGIARTYTPTNLYYPKGVLTAMGLDADDILANLSQFRASINLFARSLSAFHLPTQFTFIMRHQWMCNDLFVDSTSSKAQTYLYVPDGFWVYDNTYTTGTKLALTKLANPTGTALKWSDLDTLWQNIYQAIQNDEDIRAMSGIIAMSFPDSILIAPEIPDDYTVVPSYDEKVLMQIHNSIAVGTAVSTEEDYTITQNPEINNGSIVSKYSHVQPAAFGDFGNFSGSVDMIINYYKDDITTDDVMEATRLMSTYTKLKNASNVYDITISTCGSELVTYYQVVTWRGHGLPKFYLGTPIAGNNINYDSTGQHPETIDAVMQAIHDFSHFDWAPIISVSEHDAGGGFNTFGIIADIDVYATVNEAMLKQMHRVALLSEFDFE